MLLPSLLYIENYNIVPLPPHWPRSASFSRPWGLPAPSSPDTVHSGICWALGQHQHQPTSQEIGLCMGSLARAWGFPFVAALAFPFALAVLAALLRFRACSSTRAAASSAVAGGGRPRFPLALKAATAASSFGVRAVSVCADAGSASVTGTPGQGSFAAGTSRRSSGPGANGGHVPFTGVASRSFEWNGAGRGNAFGPRRAMEGDAGTPVDRLPLRCGVRGTSSGAPKANASAPKSPVGTGTVPWEAGSSRCHGSVSVGGGWESGSCSSTAGPGSGEVLAAFSERSSAAAAVGGNAGTGDARGASSSWLDFLHGNGWECKQLQQGRQGHAAQGAPCYMA